MGQEYSAEETSRFFTFKEDGTDLQIHYNDCDPGANGQTIVMLHGSGPGASGWANFNRNISALTDAGFRVVLLDCPGWSKSDTIICRGSRSELNARVLKGLVDHLKLPSVHIIGNSMGAHSAVAFALAHPDLVGRLVLMGGGTGGVSSFVPMPTEGIKLIGALYRDPTIENLKRMMAVFVYDPSDLTEDLNQARLKNMLARRDHLENFVKSSEANPKQFPDVGHRLGEIKAETLIIWGRNDRFVPLDTGLRLVAGIANSELHVFNNCGHWAQWEHHQKFNRMMKDFFSRESALR
ncbi:alpha/beta fold hydrolase [Cereibacter sp. SYSU M97828]|nr:alpha/beta fold hydrolase [Cereibacter flavus]